MPSSPPDDSPARRYVPSSADLSLPTLAIAGSEDGSTPPDLVRETAALVKGSRFELIRGAGHLPCVEDPGAFAAIVSALIIAANEAAPFQLSIK